MYKACVEQVAEVEARAVTSQDEWKQKPKKRQKRGREMEREN